VVINYKSKYISTVENMQERNKCRKKSTEIKEKYWK